MIVESTLLFLIRIACSPRELHILAVGVEVGVGYRDTSTGIIVLCAVMSVRTYMI